MVNIWYFRWIEDIVFGGVFFLYVCILYNLNLRNDVEISMYFLFVKIIGKEIDI